MCLILFAWKVHPRYRLVLAGNRDEFLDRPTAQMDYWDDLRQVVGGRDVEKGGSWLAADINGRWSAVTNFRDGGRAVSKNLSRGHLISDYLASDHSARSYAQQISTKLARYPGCNLLIGEPGALYFSSNRFDMTVKTRAEQVMSGIHGLSNHSLDTPWPKVERCKRHMDQLMQLHGNALVDGLFEMLSDRTEASDAELPSTGVSHHRERALSAPFIVAGDYGTRASTVMLMGYDGNLHLYEQSFGAAGARTGKRSYSLSYGGKSG